MQFQKLKAHYFLSTNGVFMLPPKESFIPMTVIDKIKFVSELLKLTKKENKKADDEPCVLKKSQSEIERKSND